MRFGAAPHERSAVPPRHKRNAAAHGLGSVPQGCRQRNADCRGRQRPPTTIPDLTNR
nr:MAG TPA: hypothetical protein [Caudoviricetes sp.]